MTFAKKLDDGKARWDLLPWDALQAVVGVMTDALVDYVPDSWRDVPSARRRYTAALMRHLTARIGGEVLDPKSHRPHMAHVATNGLFLCALDLMADRAESFLEPIEHPET